MTLNTQKLDWVIETPPTVTEHVRFMMRLTRQEMLEVKREKPYFIIRRATQQDYREGLQPANLNLGQALEVLKPDIGVIP
jgi:hypothetical protein